MPLESREKTSLGVPAVTLVELVGGALAPLGLGPFGKRKSFEPTHQGSFFYVFYAFAIGSPRGMQTKQQGLTNAMPAAPYKVTWAVI